MYSKWGTGSPGGMITGSSRELSTTLMKNCAVAELGSPVRAMATMPTVLCRPLATDSRPSWAMAGRVGFCL